MTASSAETVRRRYFLASHIHYRNVEGRLILLDLKRNRYLLLGEKERRLFRFLFEGQAHPSPEGSREGGLRALEETAVELVAEGILVTDSPKGRRQQTPDLPPASKDMNSYIGDDAPAVRAIHFFRCLRTFLQTIVIWRFYSMGMIVRRLRRRKARRRGRAFPPANLAEIQELIQIFRTLRVLFYTPHNRCLFDSIMLVNFLALHDIYPDLVFGVQMGPFAAHAWVQAGDRLYTGHLSEVADFTPILAI